MLLKTALGDVIREERTRQKKTLRDVSKEARVALGYLSEIERGHKEVSSELLEHISYSLGLSVAELLYRTAEMLSFYEITEFDDADFVIKS